MNTGTDISGKIQLYNLLADLCRYIIVTQPKNYLVKYSCISPEEKIRIEEKIQHGTSFTLNIDGHFMPVRESDLTNEYAEKLCIFAEDLKAENDRNCIMRLIQAMDEVLSPVLTAEISLLEESSKTRELNSNKDVTGIELLPRCKCVWARKSRQSFSYRRLDNYLTNVMVIEDDNSGENMRDEHIFLPRGFFCNFDETGQLKVAASPLTSRANFNIHFHKCNDMQVFDLNYYEEQMEEDCKLVWDKICEAGQNCAEIVVFPEMLGNEKMENYIIEKIHALSESTRSLLPAMMVLPSFFTNGANYCSVLDRNGNVLARQHKQNPYVMKCDHGEYMENITGSGVMDIFHYEGIGRFAVLICKDFLTTRYMERLMRDYMLTMVIVPAYSTGAYDFKMSFDLCAHDYCNVVWINSCAAMIPGKEENFEYIGYIRKRINRHQSESEAHYKMTPCPGLLTGKCDKSCIYFDSFGSV